MIDIVALRENMKVLSFRDNVKESIINKIEKLQYIIMKNFDNLVHIVNRLLDIDSKEKMLLEFRRFMEQLCRTDLILVTENIHDKKLTVLNNENIIFYINNPYYNGLKLVTFLDIFQIETNGFKRIPGANVNGEPHLGHIVTYIEKNYNGTYRFFNNRNLEYHVIYNFIYEVNNEIKDVIEILNSYHYIKSEENLELYSCGIDYVRSEISIVVEAFKKIKQKFLEIS